MARIRMQHRALRALGRPLFLGACAALIGCSDPTGGGSGGAGTTTTGSSTASSEAASSSTTSSTGTSGAASTSSAGAGGAASTSSAASTTSGTGGAASTSSTGAGAGGTGSGGGPVGSPCGTLAGTSNNPVEAFLDVGHTTYIDNLFVSGDRALSYSNKRWMLWDTATATQIAGGYTSAGVEMRGDLVLVRTVAGSQLELRSAADGSVKATVSASYGSAMGLAVDGSYVWAAANGGITIWSPTGTLLRVWPAASFGPVFAAPGALRVAPGTGRAKVITTVPVDGSPTTVTPPFSGSFFGWFEDGERFFSTVGSSVWVYSKDAVQQTLMNLPMSAGLGGAGDYFWTFQQSNPLMIFQLGKPTPLQAQYTYGVGTKLIASPRGILLINSDVTKTVDVFDLGGPAPLRFQTNPHVGRLMAAALDSGLHWVLGSEEGVVYHQKWMSSDPLDAGMLGCGKTLALGGASGGDVAIATASGRIFVYAASALAAGPKTTLSLDSDNVQLSANGAVLAAHANTHAAGGPDHLHVFSLPQATKLFSWTTPNQATIDFSLSLSGTAVGRDLYDRYVNTLPGGAVVFSESGSPWHPPPYPSPDGTRFVLGDNYPQALTGCGTTRFYQGSTLVNAVPGCAKGWIDDNRVIVQTYTQNQQTLVWLYQSTVIYDALGNPIASPPLGDVPLTDFPSFFLNGFQTLSPTSIYIRGKDAVRDLATGATLKTFPAQGHGTAAGADIVYPCAEGVCAAPY